VNCWGGEQMDPSQFSLNDDIFFGRKVKMKKIVRRVGALSILFLLFSSHLMAGNQIGKVKEIHVRNDNLQWVLLEGAHSGKPSCATGNYWMIENESSAGGKGQLSVLLSAQAQGKQVSIAGTNTCSRWADGESIGELAITQ